MNFLYRPEIDGLRTVAVLSVLFYHAKFTWRDVPVLPGGFFGVDVFFVISGFLITSLILREWDSTGRFSFIGFYERRVRRLLPTLVLVILASWPVAWVLLMPSEMMDLVRSQLASLFFVSNLYWWDAAQEYGQHSGLLQPFLHTWSLAVEEQFYLIFPLAYLALLCSVRRDWVIIAAGVACVLGGLAFAELMTVRARSLSFYWLPSRIWELLAGAVLAHLLYRYPLALRGPWMLRAMPSLGLGLILVPMIIASLGANHPGLGTVPVVLGTVLVIWFAHPGDPVTRVLSSRPFVAVGLVSYALYLWHFPIFAFGRMMEAEPGAFSKLLWLGLSFALAILSYKLVERPFRDRQRMPVRRLASLGGGAAVIVGVFVTVMISTEGMKSRFPGLVTLYAQNEFDNEILRERSWEPLANLAAAQGYSPSTAHTPSAFEAAHLWFDTSGDDEAVLLVGNSHSKDMFNAFHLNQRAFPDQQFARFGMHANMPRDQIQALFNAPNFHAADTVVLSFRYTKASLAKLPTLIAGIQQQGKSVVLMLNTVELQSVNGKPLFDWFLQDAGPTKDKRVLNALAWIKRDLSETTELNAKLKRIARQTGIVSLDKAAFICTPRARRCDAVTHSGYKAFYDYGHFTLEGAQHFGRKIAKSDWFTHEVDLQIVENAVRH